MGSWGCGGEIEIFLVLSSYRSESEKPLAVCLMVLFIHGCCLEGEALPSSWMDAQRNAGTRECF